MMTVKNALFLGLALVSLGFILTWVILARTRRTPALSDEKTSLWYHALVGLILGFFDTLGIGNFAPTTSAIKMRGSLPDEKIPGTLNVGYALPTVTQAFIYLSIIEVEVWTLVLMILAAVLGAWLGAGVVARWPRRRIQVGMGLALLGAAVLLVLAQFKVGPPEGTARTLTETTLGLALLGNFLLGALMTVGIGLYAPCLIMVSLLGMDPKAAFPIMMGSCAFLMPIGGVRFIRAGSYSLSTALTLTCTAIPGVLVAAFLVGEMDLRAVRWLVIVVVVLTAGMMLRSACTPQRNA